MSDRPVYPQIIIPQAIKDALKAKPEAIQLEKPTLCLLNISSELSPEPIKPEKISFFGFLISLFFAAIASALIGYIIDIDLVLPVAIFFIGSQIYVFIIDKIRYTANLKDWEIEVLKVRSKNKQKKELINKENQQRQLVYNRDLLTWQQEYDKINDPTYIKKYKREKIAKELQETISHDWEGRNEKPGLCEKRLGEKLKHYFPGKIHTGLKLNNFGDSKYPYTPDFVYLDRDLNLYIDIEVDEPYWIRYDEPIPTHYLHSDKELKRNRHFLGRGWIIVRFAEEQVAYFPDSCCKTIAYLINELTQGLFDLTDFQNLPDLEEVGKWTQVEAMELGVSNYRESYCHLCQSDF